MFILLDEGIGEKYFWVSAPARLRKELIMNTELTYIRNNEIMKSKKAPSYSYADYDLL